jgi:signal transduction histidine kinase
MTMQPMDGIVTRHIDFATAMHDLRGHLGVIECCTHLLERSLERGGPVPSDLRTHLSCIESAVADSAALLDELFESIIGERPAGSHLPARPVDLVALAERIVTLERLVNDHHQFLVVALEPELAGMWSEAGLARLLRNLLSNAVKYSPAGSEVLVDLDRECDDAVLRVHDQGIGIPESETRKVLQPYYRSEKGRQTADGYGLGLASVRNSVEQLGGTIEIQPRPGGGTTFCVRLPLD